MTRINDITRDRYHALAISSVWKLGVVRPARALVIGAGALGNEVVKNLAMMGIRLIVIVDRDTVEVANLTRSVFFRETDHGHSKAEVLAARVRELNPEVETLALDGNLEEVLGLGLVRRADLIFSCLDNRLARRTVNRMCQKLAKPWVDGSMENLLGDVTVYLPDTGPCYECTLTRAEREIISQAVSCRAIALRNISLNKVPTVSTMGSIIGALQVQEAMKVLHSALADATAVKKIVVNCLINDFYQTRADRKDDCEGHFRYGQITAMPDWVCETTSPADMLAHFHSATGNEGHLRLGRDIVIGLHCARCGTEEEIGEPLRLLSVERAKCATCNEVREPRTTNVIRGAEPYASWTLRRLGIPPLDILEVRSSKGSVWYELTGDLAAFPEALSLPSATDRVLSAP